MNRTERLLDWIRQPEPPHCPECGCILNYLPCANTSHMHPAVVHVVPRFNGERATFIHNRPLWACPNCQFCKFGASPQWMERNEV